MKSMLRFILTYLTILSLLIGQPMLASASQRPDKTPAPLYIQNGSGSIPPGLLAAGVPENQHGYYIVQFGGPVEQAWKDAVTAEGAELLDYLPDFAFKARMNPGQARKVAGLGFVARVEDFHPAYKLSPDLTLAEKGIYSVRIERGSDRGLAHRAVAETGVEVLAVEENMLTIAASPAQLEAVAAVLDVAAIDNFRLFEKHNEFGGGSVMGANTANGSGYDGSTQIVAVADTGLGGGTSTTAHADIPSSRVTAIYNWPGAAGGCFQSITNDGAIDVDSGHGTHTAGSVLSDGDATGHGKGTAPAARLVFQAVENFATTTALCQILGGYPASGYFLTGLPSDLNQLYQQAYAAGARIHSNSWGSAAAGDYTATSASTDTFVWNNKDMVITFSAGNDGIDANSDGVVDADSMGAPATAKNVITVGASENGRTDGYPCDSSLSYTSCAPSGVNSPFTYGAAWPGDYPANPIASDVSTGNIEQMAAFSSRGPTDDGRIKPDVVAPGTWILSAYSDLYQQGYDASTNPKNNTFQYDGWGFPYSSLYKYMGGTSMSNPLAAGGAAVIRDYFQKVYGLNASAALVKGVMVNTAVDLADENNDGANDNDFPIPNNNEGWGRVNLIGATNGSVKFVENSGLATNATASYSVTTTGGPLKITVVWSDYPSTEAATVNLVNDLDLTVSGPAGSYLGNVFAGGWSSAGGSADRRNNLENVYIANPGAGTYTVTVKGYNVPNGPQPFALVVTGGSFDTVVTPTPSPTPEPTATPTPAPVSSTGFLSPASNAAVTKSAGDNNGYEISPASAYADDNVFAEDRSSGTGSGTSCTSNKRDKHQFTTYSFNLPGSAVVKGIELRLDAKAGPSTGGSPQICAQLSWDNGATWTAAKTTPVLSLTETTYTLGGAADTWGRTWTPANFANTSFRVRIADLGTNTSTTFYLDYIAVNVTYQP